MDKFLHVKMAFDSIGEMRRIRPGGFSVSDDGIATTRSVSFGDRRLMSVTGEEQGRFCTASGLVSMLVCCLRNALERIWSKSGNGFISLFNVVALAADCAETAGDLFMCRVLNNVEVDRFLYGQDSWAM